MKSQSHDVCDILAPVKDKLTLYEGLVIQFQAPCKKNLTNKRIKTEYPRICFKNM